VSLAIVAGSCAPGRERAEPIALGPPERVSVNWNPPQTTIDSRYLKMAKALLGNGLGDPRWGTYCEVTVKAFANERYTQGRTKHGWVRPDGKHVVLLDGLEYPLKSLIRKANIHDMSSFGRNNPLLTDSSNFDPFSTVAAPAMLLLTGHPELAASAFKDDQRVQRGNPARELCTSLFEEIYMRVAQALLADQDAAGLSWARRLAQVAQVARSQGVNPDLVDLGPFKQTQLEFAQDLFHYMDQRVKGDQVRTAKSTSHDAMAELIESLDHIKGQQYHKLSTFIDYTSDPICSAILDRGKAAVPALIDAMGRDRRFIGYFAVSGGMSEPTYTVHPTTEIIAELLSKIWPSSIVCFKNSREQTALALRAAWPGDSRRTENEQWAEVLADDHSTPGNWLKAAQYLVSPRVSTCVGGRRMSAPDPVSPLRAASLQAARGAEIGGLMAKRALQIARTSTGTLDELQNCADALSLGECLGFWSPSTCAEPLRELTKLAQRTIVRGTSGHADYGQIYAEPYSRIIAFRLQCGDRSAIDDLPQVLQTFTPATWVSLRVLKPFGMLPHDPETQAAIDKYVVHLQKQMLSSSPQTVYEIAYFLIRPAMGSPLLANSSFRRMLATACTNRVSGIDAWVQGANSLDFSTGRGGRDSFNILGVNPDQPTKKHIAVSAGDFVAQVISDIPTAPPYCMVWPAEKRQAAKQNLTKWLLDDTENWLGKARSTSRYWGED